jgi:hypothetical protein
METAFSSDTFIRLHSPEDEKLIERIRFEKELFTQHQFSEIALCAVSFANPDLQFKNLISK